MLGLFLDALGQSELRPTKDVDCIVPQLDTQIAWWKLEGQLRARHWSPDSRGPICRYISPRGTLVDLMSENPSVLGISSRWYSDVVVNAVRKQLVTGRSVLVPTPSLLLCCKLEAWESRGVVDPYGSKHLEDIASLLDGCGDLELSITQATAPQRHWIARALRRIEGDTTHREALVGQLPRGGDGRRQEQRVFARLARLMVM